MVQRGDRPITAGPSEEVEDHRGDQVGPLDVDEVADVLQRHEPPCGGTRWAISSGRVPQPISSISRPARRGTACRARASATSTTPAATGRTRRSASTGRASSASRRRPGGRRSADVEQPLVRQARVQPAASACQLVERARLADQLGGAPAMVEPGLELGRQHARTVVVGDVGRGALGRQAVEVDDGREPVGQRVGQLQHHPAPLEWPSSGAGDEVTESITAAASRRSASHE